MVNRSIRGSALHWRKGSASQEGKECVEVAATEASVLIRDSRDHSAGTLALNSAEWRTLIHAIRNGDLDGC